MSSEGVAFGSCPVPVAESERVVLAHGSGGRLSLRLIEELIVPILGSSALERLEDQAILPVRGGRLAFTTDSFVVTPLFFPGGDIGELAVNGTVNDLAVGGARPIALSVALVLEEGLPLTELRRVLESIRRAADRAEVPIVTGDTKVVGRGQADRLFITTAGIGEVTHDRDLGASQVRAGDRILVSGTLGDHGVAILSQRNGLQFGGALASDTAPLTGLVETLLAACRDVHAMRDPTRGGLAATVVEIAKRAGVGVELEESALPIQDAVRGACELLGLDPLLVANEGKLVAFVPESQVQPALAALRSHPLGRAAACIGSVTDAHPGLVTVRTPFGASRLLALPLGEQLPRIC